jgi:ubiquinone/menaquinone biosynthesis C-methylase UbiE
MTKKILDACCGSRMWHFNKNNPNVLFMDNRKLNTKLCDGRKLIVNPDVLANFTNIPFDDNSFYLVVFDPPHLKYAGSESFLAKKYGTLPKDWETLINKGFKECWRVLKTNGTLIFKWSEQQISTGDVLKIIPKTPIVGQCRGKTIFLVFFKC